MSGCYPDEGINAIWNLVQKCRPQLVYFVHLYRYKKATQNGWLFCILVGIKSILLLKRYKWNLEYRPKISAMVGLFCIRSHACDCVQQRVQVPPRQEACGAPWWAFTGNRKWIRALKLFNYTKIVYGHFRSFVVSWWTGQMVTKCKQLQRRGATTHASCIKRLGFRCCRCLKNLPTATPVKASLHFALQL